jgi:hypothetical protein
VIPDKIQNPLKDGQTTGDTPPKEQTEGAQEYLDGKGAVSMKTNGNLRKDGQKVS